MNPTLSTGRIKDSKLLTPKSDVSIISLSVSKSQSRKSSSREGSPGGKTGSCYRFFQQYFIERYSNSTNQASYSNGKHQGAEVESAKRCQARWERNQRTVERAYH